MKQERHILFPHFGWAALLAVVSVHAFAGEPVRYGLDNLLSNAPEVARSIRPSEQRGLSAQDLDTPARQANKHRVDSREAPATQTPTPSIDWHSVVQNGLKRHAPPEKKIAGEEVELPLHPRTPQERLVVAASEGPRIVRRKEPVQPSVSDLSEFRVRAIQSEVALPDSGKTDFPRHNPFVGRTILPVHIQGYTQSFTAP